MPHVNIEIKARCAKPERARATLMRLRARMVGPDYQSDTYFQTPNGRLKLRVFGPESGELIFYVRDDVAGPKESSYVISKTTEPASLAAALSGALGTRGVVRKRRTLYLVGRTRIHVDDVEGLGHFLELEYVEPEGAEPGEGVAVAGELMRALGVDERDLVTGAYVDLLDV